MSVDTKQSTISIIANVHNAVPSGDAWNYAKSLRVDVAVTHPARSYGSRWDLETVEPSQGPFRDVFAWIETELVADDTDSVENADDNAVCERARRRRVRDQLDIDAGPRFEAAARNAIVLCDHEARASALRMNKFARFFTYAALLGGHRERLAQLITTCPAVLTLAAVSDPHSGDGLLLLESVRAGRKLARVIELALGGMRHQSYETPVGLCPSAATLVRAAGNLPFSDLSAVLRAPGLDINDLPRPGTARERWLNMMATWSRCSMRRSIQDPDQVGGFLSRHALDFLDGDPECAVEILLDWVERSGAPIPSRRSSSRRVRMAIERWHRTSYLEVSYPPATELAPGPVPTKRIAGMRVRAIRTVGELQAEAAEMRHCVSSLVDDALAGRTYLYSARIAGARVTIAVAPLGTGWYLQEAAGAANRQLDFSERRSVQRWVETLR